MKKFKRLVKSKRNLLAIIIIGLLVLAVTVSVAYKAGQQQAMNQVNKKTNSVAFTKDLFKKLPSKSGSEAHKPSFTSSSSGFFRLSGTIQTVSKSGYTVKLANGNTVNVSSKDTTVYYGGGAKIQAKDIVKNSQVLVMGTITADGTFTVTSIQKK